MAFGSSFLIGFDSTNAIAFSYKYSLSHQGVGQTDICTLAIELTDFLVVDKSISAPGNEPRPKHGAIGGELTILALPLCSWITSAADKTSVFFSPGKSRYHLYL